MGAILGLTFLMGFVLYKRYFYTSDLSISILVCLTVCLSVYLSVCLSVFPLTQLLGSLDRPEGPVACAVLKHVARVYPKAL